MAVDFLTLEQKAQYGQYVGDPNDIQLSRYFHLDKTDLEFISNRRGNQNKLGFALQLTSVRFLGTFLIDLTLIPINVQTFVAHQISISEIAILRDYAKRDTTKREHTALIRQYYGYRDFSEQPWSFRLSRLLYARAWVGNERPSLMFDFATSWLTQHKIILPGETTLSRLISEIRERSSKRLWTRLSALPTSIQKLKLEALLHVSEGDRTSRFDYYRKGPVTISSPAFNETMKRYLELREFGLSKLNFSHIPPVRLKNLASHAGVISMKKIARMPDNRRIAMLVAFVKSFEIFALDDALDVLDLLIAGISSEAKKNGQKKRLRTLKDLDKSALILAKTCEMVLNESTDSAQLREEIYTLFSKEKLLESITIVNDLARSIDDRFHDEMVEQYGKVRKFIRRVVNDIAFKAAPAGKSTLEALKYLAKISSSRKQNLENPPLDIITQPWKRLVFDKEGNITRKGYTLCFLNKLQDSLRRRDVYVENSDRWGDTRAKLLQDEDWESNKIQVCRSLGRPILPHDAIASLAEQLDSTYKKVADNFENNNVVRIDRSGKNSTLTITNFDKLEDPLSLTLLKAQIKGLLPKIDLTELVLEIHAHTEFANEFTHVSESNARTDDLSISVCAVLLAEACNIGLEPLVKHHIPALTRHRLNWVKQNYIRAETLIRANARLVDHQATLPLAKKWGGGEVASADGMRFITPIRTINAGPNRKYFGSSKGITWYNFISDQFSGFHGIVIPGTLRDSIFVLEGLLEQQTGLNPIEIMTDTTGTSDMIFGLFWLLGYQFSPRLADAGEAIFWRIGKEANYGILNDLARGYANPRLIEQNWDDMMRIAGSLKLGTVSASELIRTLLKSDRPSSLAKAIIELGRINKTLYLLNYVNDEDYRRRILTQLNRGEGRHSVARIICHGQRGEIHKRYREGQENQLGSLGLVTNAVVLWNTIYMNEGRNYLEQQSIIIREEDEARLSPLQIGHINVLGHYSFNLTEQVMKGTLRPLNQLSENIDNVVNLDEMIANFNFSIKKT